MSEHLALLQQGVEAWNLWRVANPLVRPNFIFVALPGAHLAGAYLRDAILNVADFRQSDLSGAVLADASLVGTILREANLQKADLTHSSLFQANLADADLRGADLREANLDQTILRRADLRNADLRGASMRATDLTDARLAGADLAGANLTGANLTGADCQGVSFQNALLVATELAGADFSQATVGWTRFADLDLSQTRGLDELVHLGPSSIGLDTIYRCGTDVPDSFLQGVGVPDIFLTYMASLLGQAIEFFSCCVRCAPEDRRLGERLYADLRARGIRTWFRPEDLAVGGRGRLEVDQSIKTFDRLVLVCSEAALQHEQLVAELEQALERGRERETPVLFAVQADGYLADGWQHRSRPAALERAVGDFSGWEHDVDRYEAAFTQLIEHLAPVVKASQRRPTGPIRF